MAIVVAVLVVGAIAFVVVGRDRSSGAPRQPVLEQARVMYNGDLGDPYVLPVPGRDYIAFGTGNWPARIPTAHSSDLINWQAGPDAMPDLPSWSPPDPKNAFSWAPTVLATPSGYVMYMSSREARSGRQCIGAASSASPTGPYRHISGQPLICQLDLGGSIDPSVFRDEDGAPHLIWKSDGNCCDLPTGLFEQALSADGLRLLGQPQRLLEASQPWQGGVVEEPAMVRATHGAWWLFYSGNRFDSADYATGVAYCESVSGPCRDLSPVAFPLVTSPGQHAPGGLETFRDASGTFWAVYHTWNRPSRNGRFYCCREVEIARVRSL